MIRHRILVLVFAAAAVSAAPVHAAIYSGTLQGVITTGQASYSDFVASEQGNYDLTVDAISITFTADVEHNYTDPIFGDF